MTEHCSFKKRRSIARYLCVWVVLVAGAIPLQGQSHLDEYVQQGLESNAVLKQAEFGLEKSLLALKEAKSLYLPSVNFSTNYFLAGGGRTVDFPAGDLLNPVYSTLNQLTGTQNFPQLENQSILLNPNNFYDVKFRVSMPIYQAEIAYNQRIKAQQVSVQSLEMDVYRRELVKDIKTAYFQYLKASEAVKIYATALELVEENHRINQSLFKNQKINQTAVLRSENEVTKYQSLQDVAAQSQLSAQAYVNFLLNRNATDPILIDTIFQIPQNANGAASSVAGREELKQLDVAANIQQEVVSLSEAYRRPKLGAFVDLGSQGFNFEVNDKSLYYFFGVSLEWNVFAGNRNQLKTRQAELDSQILQSKTLYAEDQLQLQLTTTRHAYQSALIQYQAAQSQLNSTEKYFADFLRLYKEGQALFIELLDAQNQWVSAKLQANIALFEIWNKAAEIERASASFTLKP